jgi:histidyl-tRNA synthetase
MIKPLPISWFWENLPENQILEDYFRDIIRKNYSLWGFTPLDTSLIERLEVLTAKWADDNEIYGIHRINGETWDDSSLWLRFDLTVPLARYIAQYEGELTFPFRRQHIARVYRWERPQKARFREFYQADVDIIWNGELALFADCEVIYTIFWALFELDFWDFQININNKKFLSWFLESIWVKKIKETIWFIDKKDKIKAEKLREMFVEIGLSSNQINEIFQFIKFWQESTNEEILAYFSQNDNNLLKEWITELKKIYEWLLTIWINRKYLKINPSISRWLNYYTWTVFETFIVWAESLWSIASGGRYENLASNFTKNNYPWVWGSIWLTRLLAVLNSLWKLKINRKTVSKVLVLNMWNDFLETNLKIVETLRKAWINTEFYLDEAKIQKQLKYANNKKIHFVVICWEEEEKREVVQLKNLDTWEQIEIKKENLTSKIISL